MKKLTERKREDIIQAAKDVFRDQGFNATSMDRVAETAGVSKRTLYNHFESKEALFITVSEELCKVFSQVSEHPYEANEPLRPQLEAIAKKQMALLCNERFLRSFKMFTSETLTSPELTKPIMEDLQKESIGVVKWLTAASQAGRLSCKDPVMAGKQFMALLEVFTSWPYLFGMERAESQKEQADVINSAVDMFLDHYVVGVQPAV